LIMFRRGKNDALRRSGTERPEPRLRGSSTHNEKGSPAGYHTCSCSAAVQENHFGRGRFRTNRNGAAQGSCRQWCCSCGSSAGFRSASLASPSHWPGRRLLRDPSFSETRPRQDKEATDDPTRLNGDAVRNSNHTGASWNDAPLHLLSARVLVNQAAPRVSSDSKWGKPRGRVVCAQVGIPSSSSNVTLVTNTHAGGLREMFLSLRKSRLLAIPQSDGECRYRCRYKYTAGSSTTLLSPPTVASGCC